MKTTVVANPVAGSGKVGRSFEAFRRAISLHFDSFDVVMTSADERADRCVRRAVADGAERLVVVGGDGTLSEAVNGLPWSTDEAGPEGFPELIYLPAGTGGDFARSTGSRGLGVTEILEASTSKAIDLGRVVFSDQIATAKYFVNEASVGASALIVEKVNRSSKAFGGTISFVVGSIQGLLDWRDRRVRLQIDDTFDDVVPLCLLAISNGRYFGGGMKIAPNAILNDGLLDIVLVKEAGTATFVRHGSKLYQGKHLDLPIVSSFRGKHIRVEPLDEDRGAIPIEMDGETAGHLPVQIEIQPETLNLIAPWSSAEAVKK